MTILAGILALACLASGQRPPAPPTESLLISGARVLAPDGMSWLSGRDVLIAGGRIAAVAGRGSIPRSQVSRRLNAAGLYLIPGLMDLHVHLLLHPYNEASWNDQVLKESLGERLCRAVGAARRTLEAGFTTLRDLGTEGAGFADVGLKSAWRLGLVESPRLFVATRALVATGCYGPAGFDPRYRLPKGAQECDGVAGVRKAVRQQIAAGADWVKFYADYRRRPGDASTPTFSSEEVAAIVDEAHSAGLPVAAHAVTDAAIQRAVRAGVQTIEHGYGASLGTLRLMHEKRVVLCPTLSAQEAMARYRGWQPGQPKPESLRAARTLIQRALEAGVSLASGSDAGVFTHGQNVREIELMSTFGLGPKRALKAATISAARVLGRAESLGRIQPGFEADLLLLDKDPLESPKALWKPLLVMQQGRVIVDRRDAPRRLGPLSVCKDFLEAWSKHRLQDAQAFFAKGAVVALARDSGQGSWILPAQEFLDRARQTERPAASLKEWISDVPKVHVDHRLALVWAPFTLESHGQSRQGVDVFNLVRQKDGWKILALSFTNRAP